MRASKDYEYALSLTSQFYFCSVPFRLDISPQCTMGCQYCFSLARGGKRSTNNMLVDPKRLARKLDNVFNSRRINLDINGELLKLRMPIHLGGMSDPFSNKEYTKRTIEILDALDRFDYPLILSSKQTGIILQENVLSALRKLRYLTLQISVPIPDDRLSSIIEPGAPVFSKRLDHINTLHDEGIHVVARLQPILVPLLDIIRDEAIPGLQQAGCSHVILECLKIPLEKSDSFNSLCRQLRWDAHEYYAKRGAIVVGRDKVLPPKIAWEFVFGLVKQLKSLGFTYGTNDHGLFHLGNTSCCCGVADRKGFEGIFKSNFTNVIRTASSDELSFHDVLDDSIPRKSIRRYINSNSRLQKKNSILTHLHDKWNKPGNVNAPDAFLGVKYTGNNDENGDCLYDKSEVQQYLAT